MLIPLLAAVADSPSPSPAPTKYVDPETVTPGLLGLVIFVALAVATFFLWRSMNKQLKRIDFHEEDGGDDAAADGPDDAASADPRDAASRSESGTPAGEPSVDLTDKS